MKNTEPQKFTVILLDNSKIFIKNCIPSGSQVQQKIKSAKIGKVPEKLKIKKKY